MRQYASTRRQLNTQRLSDSVAQWVSGPSYGVRRRTHACKWKV